MNGSSDPKSPLRLRILRFPVTRLVLLGRVVFLLMDADGRPENRSGKPLSMPIGRKTIAPGEQRSIG